MNKGITTPSISEEELLVITNAIWNRYGIDFRNYENSSLVRRVKRVLERFGLESVYELWKKFLYEQDFIDVFIDEITVGLTELFRNPSLWTFIGDELLSKLPAYQSLTVWHAGCSTGEEVYSMLITLSEYHKMNQSQLWASDISQEALQAARQGQYDRSLWNKYNENYREFSTGTCDLSKYTTFNEEGFQMKKYLRDKIEFSVHNLVRDAFPPAMDWIFCRNVLIYFDEKLKINVLQKFYEALKPGGLLILGFYDYIPDAQDLFKPAYPAYKIFTRSE